MIIRLGDKIYPPRLEKLSRPPSILYVRGTMPEVPMVAIVGSRAALISSVHEARALAQRVAELGYGVVSGGALGIDRAAHEGALLARMPTVAVLGTGLDCLYPPQNHTLFQQIVDSGGALVSSFCAGTKPRYWHFPHRNRLIAAWSELVVVVEAGVKSGSLSTAAAARELGIPVAVFPNGKGISALVQSGAIVVRSSNDILALLQGQSVARSGCIAQSDEEKRIIAAINGQFRTLDEIQVLTDLPLGMLAGLLMRLELRGCLITDVQGRYHLV